MNYKSTISKFGWAARFALTFFFVVAVGQHGLAQTRAERINLNFNPILSLGEVATQAITVQPDGKILVGGSFGQVNFTPKVFIARFNADGSLDNTFSFDNSVTAYGNSVSDIIVLNDNRILMVGNFTITSPKKYDSVIILNSDGSLDTSFINPFGNIVSSRGQSIADAELQPDGKILLGGYFVSGNPSLDQMNLMRINANGSIDSTFLRAATNGGISAIKVQSDGRIIIGGDFTKYNSVTRSRIARINSDGSLDTTFLNGAAGADNGVTVVELQPDGKILVGGAFTSINGATRGKIARLNADGSLDAGFQNASLSSNTTVRAIARQSNGRILLGRSTYGATTVTDKLLRLNDDGSTDATFNPAVGNSSPNDYVSKIVLLDNNILLGGFINSVNQTVRQHLVKLNPDGTLDRSFALVLFENPGSVTRIARQADGKILFTGTFQYVNGVYTPRLGRVNADGSPDYSFNAGQLFSGNSSLNNIVPLPNNKILVTGQFFTPAYTEFARLNSDGSLDTTVSLIVNGGGSITSVALQPDGKIIIGGTFTSINNIARNRVARLNADFSLDTTFLDNQDGVTNGNVSTILAANDKTYLGGTFTTVNGQTRSRLARLNADGSLDTAFQADVAGGTFAIVSVIKQQPNGRILIGGSFSMVNGAARTNLARLNADGSLDASFPNSSSGTNSDLRDIAVQSNGQIIVVGSFSAINNTNIVRFNADGTVDNQFLIVTTFASGVFVEPNGNIIIGGSFGQINGITRSGLLRVNRAGQLFDFDGDGRADLSVFRPSDRVWYLLNSQSGFSAAQFGLSTDKLVPADFDGDGKTDLAVFRDGTWYWLNSSNNTFNGLQFGLAGDIPVPADYTGDGRAELAVYRGGVWYTLNLANNQFQAAQFGLATDKPVPADYDGDGKTDFAVYRDGVWYVQQSSKGFAAAQFGLASDKPTVGDYDGDGKADFAVYRNGTWYVLGSSQGFYGLQFGIASDIPVAADYDGDGKTDFAVYRNGVWYVQQSSKGFAATQFGLANDKAVPAAFVP